MFLRRHTGTCSWVSQAKIQRPKATGNATPSARSTGAREALLFHTQTVHWRGGTADDGEATEAERRGRLLSFRPPDDPSGPLRALTANDYSGATWAMHRLKRGRALVYSGGDYHNARQLLEAVKRKFVRASDRENKKEEKRKKIHSPLRKKGAGYVFDLGEEWLEQRRLQREQSAIVHKILIRVSLEDDGRPGGILDLKRTPDNADDVFAYAFQNDGVVSKLGDGDETVFVSLAEFVAMLGGYEWNRKGVHIHALGDRIVPHFGVFPPTRQDYLRLMDHVVIDADARTTLRRSEQPVRMMEVGIGTGVLSIILLRRKVVDRVIGTDINPYAVACAKENLQRFDFRGDVVLADLFPPKAATNNDEGSKVDAVLFNPPWVPGDASTWLDKSVYDPDQNLLRRFLLQARHHVKEDGHVYLLLSNLGILLGLFSERDLHAMFEEGNLDLVAVHAAESKAGKTKRRPVKNAEKNLLDGIKRAKEQEIISLYHLRLRKSTRSEERISKRKITAQ